MKISYAAARKATGRGAAKADAGEVGRPGRAPEDGVDAPQAGVTAAGDGGPEPGWDDNLDRRAGDLVAVRTLAPAELEGRIRRAFEGSELLRDRGKLDFLRAFLGEVHERFNSVNRGFLELGQMLLDARDRLREDYDRLEGADILLPFSKGTASKLRTIAASVRSGLIRGETLPPYTIAYQLAKLPPPVLEEARAADLIRPDVRRTEVASFLQARRPPAGAPDAGGTASLRRERGRLAREVEQHRRAIERAQGRIGEIDAVLGALRPRRPRGGTSPARERARPGGGPIAELDADRPGKGL